jgi:cell division protein FtsZ
LCTEPVVLVAGLGRGTGTGVTHVVARIARKLGCDVSVVVIWPFYFEGRERLQRAKRALSVLKKYPLTTVFLPELLPLPIAPSHLWGVTGTGGASGLRHAQ